MICDLCHTAIAGTAADPICCTSLGNHHYECMRAADRDARRAADSRREASRARRSAAMKARWALR